MFTGLISAIGEVTRVQQTDDALELDIAAPYTDVEVGESIAVDGACLTVVHVGPGEFTVQVVTTSVDRTIFGSIDEGRAVNLERALRMGDRLGGHMVQGHVDAVGTVVAVAHRQDARLIDLTVPDGIGRVTIPLGSLAVNGVSLTVNAVLGPGVVQISLIPITLEKTNLGALEVGDRVHLEGDVIGKYIDQLIEPWRNAPGSRERNP